MKATEQYFPVVLFIVLYKVLLTFESVDKTPKCRHLNESYWAVLSCGAVYYAVQGGSNFETEHLGRWGKPVTTVTYTRAAFNLKSSRVRKFNTDDTIISYNEHKL